MLRTASITEHFSARSLPSFSGQSSAAFLTPSFTSRAGSKWQSQLDVACASFTASALTSLAQPKLPERVHTRRKLAGPAKASINPDHMPSGLTGGDLDPFIAASRRLQNLLAGVGDGEAEFVDSLVTEASPESRLQTQVILAGMVTVAAIATSTLCGNDPWGGMAMSLHSLVSGAVGVGVALPLVLLRVWSWSPAAAAMFPQLDDMHLAQLNAQAPWYARCSPWHVLLMMGLDVLPITLLLLPAAQGGLMAGLSLYTTAMNGMADGSFANPELVQLGCLALTAAVASVGKGLELGISDKEFEVVQTAVENADRYYKVMANGATSNNNGSGSAATSALAFRSVAHAWMGARNDASLAAMGLCFLDVLALGGLWYATKDFAAPAAAAMAINAVDYFYLFKAVRKRESKLAAMTGMSKNNTTSGGTA